MLFVYAVGQEDLGGARRGQKVTLGHYSQSTWFGGRVGLRPTRSSTLLPISSSVLVLLGMSDSSGDEGALQIDIGGSSESIKGGGGKVVAGRTKKGWKPGDVVWAKVTGFNYWPAQVNMRTSQYVMHRYPILLL